MTPPYVHCSLFMKGFVMVCKNTGRGTGRTRDWTFIVYPDSVPADWIKLLNNEHFLWAFSPLHDADINGDGSEKKPHWHVMIVFEGVKSYEQVLQISEVVNGTIPFRIHSKKALLRYFIHLDNPDKHQYNIDDIECFNGFDINEFMKQTSSERDTCIKEMIQFVNDNCITEFHQLVEYAISNNSDWFHLLANNSAYILEKYITSYRHSVVRER